MQQYESLITRVTFQYNGIDAYNRQQICEFTSKDIKSEFILRVGETFENEGVEYRITHINFLMLEKFYSKKRKIDVFTRYDNNPVNCQVIIFLEEVNK